MIRSPKQIARLLQARDYLRNLDEKEFAYGNIFTDKKDPSCKVCALGQLHKIFPNDPDTELVKGFTGEYIPKIVGEAGVYEFFGITTEECSHIFYSSAEDNGGDKVYDKLTPNDVADRINELLTQRNANN